MTTRIRGLKRTISKLFALAFSLALVVGASFSIVTAASAQTKPYTAHIARIVPVAPDEALKALIETVRAIAARSELSAFAPLLANDFTVIVCKPDPLAPCAANAPGTRQSDPAQKPAERLSSGLCCPGVSPEQITDELRAETVSGIISGAIESGQLSEHETPGLFCTPYWPVYDRKAAATIVTAAGSSAEFLRYAGQQIIVREKPAADAPILATLERGALTPMLSDVATQMPDGWYAIGLPSGRIGYSDMLGLEELTPSGVCFRRYGADWKIAMVITLE